VGEYFQILQPSPVCGSLAAPNAPRAS
jgi:hypothetical protein